MMNIQNAHPINGRTKRLYFEDAYLKEFEAAVVEKRDLGGKPAVVLDQTCFYPESGGQPSDRGTVDGVSVVHVLEEDTEIIHVLDKELTAPRIKGVIDWKRRFDHMQQHSGQHILSQSFVELLDGETLSFHLGEEASTLEIGLKEISEREAERVESRANEIVFEDREIKTCFVPDEKISTVPLRRPPKKEGVIRVVEVSGFDYSACGGTHCRRTGEIGLIKITKWDKIRSNMRFEFLCGGRALQDYTWKNRSVVATGLKLSAYEKDIAASVEKMLQEVKQAKKTMRKLQEQLAVYEAQDLIQKAKGRIIRQIWAEKSFEEAKLLALKIIRAGEFAVVFGIREEEKNRLILASSEKLALDMRELIPEVFSRVGGKGGGSPSLVELVMERGVDLTAVLAFLAERLEQKLPQKTP
jgi:alanyl-tRNA synthetase